MKLQPFFLFLSLLLFILSSCEQAEKSRSYQLVRSDQTLAFTLDDKTKNVTPFLSYYRDKKGKEYRHSCISPWQYNHVIQRLWTL